MMLLQKLNYAIGVADILQWAELVFEAPHPGGSDNGREWKKRFGILL